MKSDSIRLTAEEMGLINIVESLTGAKCRDCLIDSNSGRVTFIVEEGDLKLVLGKRGSNVRLIRRLLKREVDFLEYFPTPEVFIAKSLTPARVREVRITEKPNGEKLAVITVEPRDKGLAIGKNGRVIERTRKLARRYFNINHIIVV
ncbi:NusA-like transcription termination signal-binding factor [Candidatus Bathyarchaeota archaeon]|nr:NusA-like transcription termination signal-binding factor [Candidatus Bathyarchaeota archaeon]MBS7613022.1 NusA-like transcription termination signal-binding factor [Candidatus Bathyarchaeota archaeon]MBS7618179.1 NusA-like transcription termination signal-binding factor [Candidatus Bathyarchaeota archaeon]